MNELKPSIHDETNSLDYVLAGDYYIPVIELPEGEDRPIGKWGRMHRAYLEETNPLLLNHLILTGKLHTNLSKLNEQTQNLCRLIIRQMTSTESVTEELKRQSQWEWVKAMNSIVDHSIHDQHPGVCADRKTQRLLKIPYAGTFGSLIFFASVPPKFSTGVDKSGYPGYNKFIMKYCTHIV